MMNHLCHMPPACVMLPCVILAVLAPLTSAAVVSVTQLQTPQAAGLTCWTCPNKTNNEACNNWAPDVNCPTNHTVCQTVHLYDIHAGQSVAVHKRCALASQCTEDMVGCRETHQPGIMECLTCCTQSYCNELVPTSHRTALALSVFSATAPITASGILVSFIFLVQLSL